MNARPTLLTLATLLVLLGPAAALPTVTDARSAPPTPAADAMARLARDLAEDPANPVPRLAAYLLESHYGGPPEELGAAFHYTYPLGDIDGDGTGDVALDTYCVDVDGCGGTVNLLRQSCSRGHVLYALSGATGDVIWERPLDPEPFPPLFTCTLDLVLDVVPRGNGIQDLLVYRWHATGFRPSLVLIDHEVSLLDATTGEARWTYTAQGRFTGVLAGVADTLFLVPILQSPPDEGVRVVPEATQQALHVRGWGFVVQQLAQRNPLDMREVLLREYEYQPDEWLAKVDLADGSELWRRDTFLPQPERSVYPFTYHARDYRTGVATINPYTFQASYYMGAPCCWDLTGDDVPDVVYTTMEWFPVMVPDVPEQLQGYASRALAFDGATGDLVWELALEPDSDELAYVGVRPLGDVQGDGASDLATYRFYVEDITPDGELVNPRFLLEVRNGPDAAELWTQRDKTEFGLAPLGDADGDGGNELLTIWYRAGENFEAGLTEFRPLQFETVRGATGAPLWNATTHTAAIDLIVSLGNLFVNGLPDLDADGVGDVWTDETLFLADQTPVHHLTAVSGRTGQPLYTNKVVGGFAIPLRAGDTTGDGIDDGFVLSGDLVDLWVTVYNGDNGTAEWSRRLLSLPQSNAKLALPAFRHHTIQLDGMNASDLFFNFAMQTIVVDARVGGGQFTTYQQLLALQGEAGTSLWAIPELDEGDASLLRHQGTPATDRYRRSIGEVQDAEGDSHGSRTTLVAAAVGAAALSLGAGFAVPFLRRRP